MIFFLRKSLKKLQYYILYKKRRKKIGKIGVKMTTNYMITYITGGLIFWSEEKCHVSSHIYWGKVAVSDHGELFSCGHTF